MSVFLDHASTTGLRESALLALTQALELVGNPSSVHSQGRTTRELLETARDQLATACGANRSEIIFNSGGTESDNQAIKGIYWARHKQDSNRNLIITATTEHHAVIDPVLWLEASQGADVAYVKLLEGGMIDISDLENIIQDHHSRIALITLMWVNNETGVITDIPKICEIAAKYEIPVHSDAVAAFGHIPIDFAASGLAAMSLSGHKIGAPIGVGALVVARSQKPSSLIHGGGQERSLRSGTMNYPLAAGFAAAATEAIAQLASEMERLKGLRNYLEARVVEIVPGVVFTSAKAMRADYNSHLVFPGTQSDAMLFLLDQEGICVSAGSACQAGVLGPSHVLAGMGYSPELASACIRVTLGSTTTKSDIDSFLIALAKVHPIALKATPA